MKKLNKLQINHEKLMKNEELITLRGGYDGYCCTCTINGIHMAATGTWDCYWNCAAIGSGSTWLPCQNSCNLKAKN